MRKCLLILFFLSSFYWLQAATHNITIIGNSYNLSSLLVNIGDIVNIQASGIHPCVQVSQSDFNANNATPVAGGWGTNTSNFQITITNANTIYFVCSNHVFSGMKAQIVVTATPVSDNQGRQFNLVLVPNPVRNHGVLSFDMKKAGNLDVTMFDMSGRLVGVVVNNRFLVAGKYAFHVHVEGRMNGAYLLRLRTPEGNFIKEFHVMQ